MNSRHAQFVEELLNQMPQLNSEQYLNYRRELDDKLARARREEKSMRWIVIGAWLGALVLYVGGVLLFILSGLHLPDWFRLPLVLAILVLFLAALLLLTLYLFKYRRKLNHARAAAQEAALGEIQRQLNELRAQLPAAQKGQPPSPPPK